MEAEEDLEGGAADSVEEAEAFTAAEEGVLEEAASAEGGADFRGAAATLEAVVFMAAGCRAVDSVAGVEVFQEEEASRGADTIPPHR